MRRGESGLSGLIAIDKPAGMTSHDVVDRVRRIYGERRCGHAGTLDPAATGLLLVAVGPATRLCSQVGGQGKSYLAHIVFGTATDTDDAQGAVIETAPVGGDLAEREVAERLLASFTGMIEQVPPRYSAIKKASRKAYEAARAGEEFELEAREVTVHAAHLLQVCRDGSDGTLTWDVVFDVSKGTYVRALARDIGKAAGTCAHLGELRRLTLGSVRLSMAHGLDELAGLSFDEACIDPVQVLGIPAYDLSAEDARKVASGGKLSLGLGMTGELVAVTHAGRLLALYEHGDTCYRPRTVIPGGVTRGV
ncbi:MAG: tRNA pseudouridine(55) synthase TruB [Coriobacteriales bacterium]|nr:tRNA pseudouridine(55) synthase TruB [Coriobacteriales bacterium]